MSDADRAWVDEALGRAAVRAGGTVTEEDVGRFLKLTTIADRFQGEQEASPVEVIWAWMAEEQEKRDQLGSSLAWYLKAQKDYPASDFARQGIERINTQLLPDAK